MEVTIRPFSKYQIETLSGYFKIFDVTNLGLIQESGDLLIEFRGSILRDFKTIKITREENPNTTEPAEFEIIQPKLLK